VTRPFELRTSPAIVFGRGSRARIGEWTRTLGSRAFLVTGGRSLAASGELERLTVSLHASGLSFATFTVHGEPDVAVVDEAAEACKDGGCDVVVGVGGGSVLDVAKGAGAVATNGGSARDYLESLPHGGGKAIAVDPLPCVAIPTTAGSGSEVTKNAVLRVADAGLKRSLRSDRMVPRVAIVDPDLSSSAPRDVMVPAALDAFTHLLEAYVSTNHQPTTDLLAFEGLRRSYSALTKLADGTLEASDADDLALASLWGGIVLANAGLGAVHGLVAPLGGAFPVPHGCGCGALLAATVRVNVAALRARAPESTALTRYGQIARELVGADATADDVAGAIGALRTRLDSKPLAAYGVREAALAAVVQGARGGSMKTNPIVLSAAELESILRDSLGGTRPGLDVAR
jgi:alcohol dehydrogenase class IV